MNEEYFKYVGTDGYEYSTEYNSLEAILGIIDEDKKFAEHLKACEAKEEYNAMYQHIVSMGFEKFIDANVDAGNCIDENGDYLQHGTREFWKSMCRNMIDSVGMRLDECGIRASDYGIPY